MIAELLQQTGIRFRHCRFLKPPAGTYAVWTDDIETDGADNGAAAVFTAVAPVLLLANTHLRLVK